ncbi:hypothetical protein BC629DRAFT_1491838 [Irpex lacteus]|nr:hypothetical protein BC629DRAFT_1491838 [Irpex lacteus]
MSAAETDIIVEHAHEKAAGGTDTPRHRALPGSSLDEILAASDKPLIAVDLDDVLSQTNRAVIEWHNEAYGTKLDLSHCYYYYYWKNPGWGTPEETFRKVEEFYQTDYLDKAQPIPGALEGLQKLKQLGYRLVIVTARQRRELDRSAQWIEKHYPGIFEDMICTGQSQETLAEDNLFVTKLSKADICVKLGAKFLVDDSLENSLKCATHPTPTPVLLFGKNEWNQRLSKYNDIKDEQSFEQRLEKEGGREFWKEENIVIPEGIPLTRVDNWEGVLRWVEEQRSQGKL